ncbi:MAG: type II toxin-antitoxin system Phd/YefM family antitoxin [Pseudorhodoplanes sp.]|nr:type II toxin-antitoxin system Phd/YefM family antitoxin [Pseudorhodoplanes sp.]
MKALSAREAKYNFGRLVDTARAEPVVIEKHGRPVVVVLSVEEYGRLSAVANETKATSASRRARQKRKATQ